MLMLTGKHHRHKSFLSNSIFFIILIEFQEGDQVTVGAMMIMIKK